MTRYGIRHVKIGLYSTFCEQRWPGPINRHGTVIRRVRNADGYPWSSLSDPQICLPDKMKLIRQKVTRGLNRTHELVEMAYNTRCKIVEIYEKLQILQSNKTYEYNVQLGPNQFRSVVLLRKGKALYELGNAVW